MEAGSHLFSSKLPLRGRLHVTGIETQTDTIRLSLDGIVGKTNRDIVDGLAVGSEEAVLKAKLANQSHFLFYIGGVAKLQRRLRRVEHFCRADLLFLRFERVFGTFGNGPQDFVGRRPPA